MEPSTELEELYLQCCDAMSSGDDAFFERTFSEREGVLAIGTDPTEWWTDYATITKVFKAQLKEMVGTRIVADTPLACRDGSIGWVAGQPILRLPNGTEMTARLTAVFQKEQDVWKIVQWHFSMGIPNEKAIGESMTTR